ncbi:MAG TPA: hypothetical protein ACFYEK_07365 [Candidatus Wunengus sp. YC60]|uniref:hypothetical protein n=1 Tax=Candidatus Wunengus sp. YC60 TaxID=3367697 RepID=UPI0040270D2B
MAVLHVRQYYKTRQALLANSSWFVLPSQSIYKLLRQFTLINNYNNHHFPIPAKHVLAKMGSGNSWQMSNTRILRVLEWLKEKHFINTITINFDNIY